MPFPDCGNYLAWVIIEEKDSECCLICDLLFARGPSLCPGSDYVRPPMGGLLEAAVSRIEWSSLLVIFTILFRLKAQYPNKRRRVGQAKPRDREIIGHEYQRRDRTKVYLAFVSINRKREQENFVECGRTAKWRNYMYIQKWSFFLASWETCFSKWPNFRDCFVMHCCERSNLYP